MNTLDQARTLMYSNIPAVVCLVTSLREKNIEEYAIDVGHAIGAARVRHSVNLIASRRSGKSLRMLPSVQREKFSWVLIRRWCPVEL